MCKSYFILPHHSVIQIFSIIFILSMFFCGGYHRAYVWYSNIEMNSQGTELGFKSISVKEKDTLWSIAKENIPEGYPGSLHDYISEIKHCNSLVSDCINAGSSLVVPVYVPSQTVN